MRDGSGTPATVMALHLTAWIVLALGIIMIILIGGESGGVSGIVIVSTLIVPLGLFGILHGMAWGLRTLYEIRDRPPPPPPS